MMKKIAMLLAALLCLCIFAASAEDEAGIWEICKAENGTFMDFDNDGVPETVRVLFLLDEYEDGDFVLSVGNSIVTVRDCIGLEQEIYVMKAGYGWYCYGTVFMINEYGPSDDPLTYCFLYTEGVLDYSEENGAKMYYGTRFTVILGGKSNVNYKFAMLESVLEQLKEGDVGVINLSDGSSAHFIPQ